MALIINEMNTADLNSLRRSVRNLKSALEQERENADMLQAQRDSQILEATVYANVAESLAKMHGVPIEQLKKLRQQCQALCEADLKKRGIKEFAAKPPMVNVKTG